MINVIGTLAFYAAVKTAFLFTFVWRHERNRGTAIALAPAVRGRSVVEMHDRRDIVPSIRSEVHGLAALEFGDNAHLPFALHAAEQFVEGR